jgi:ABC-type antimicrobial peptide transport system permease subunit
MLMGINAKGYKIANLDEYREDNPDAEESLTLQDGEILVRQTLYDKLEEDMEVSFGDDNILTYKAVGSFPDGLGYDYIMSDKACKEMRNLMIYENRVSYIYCENPQETYDFLQENGTGYGRAFTLSLAIPAQDQVEEYQQAHSSDMGAKTLIPIAIAIISLIMVYFTIKSNASSRSEELTVYRLIGISRGSILKAYMLEMVLVTSYTSLPAVLVTCGVIQFISSVPSLEIAMNFPWWTALLLLVCLYVIHALISIMPVYGILSKPPATLAVKE